MRLPPRVRCRSRSKFWPLDLLILVAGWVVFPVSSRVAHGWQSWLLLAAFIIWSLMMAHGFYYRGQTIAYNHATKTIRWLYREVVQAAQAAAIAAVRSQSKP